MPIYEYRCESCGKITTHMQVTCDGGPATVMCEHCGQEAPKIISQVNVAEIKSGFRDGPFMMTDPETGETRPMDKDHTIMGTPREEQSKETQRLMDIEALRRKDPKEYAHKKREFQREMLDGDPDGSDVDRQEVETYHSKPGESQDEARRASPLDYPITDKHYTKIGEQVVRDKKGRVKKTKPILADKSVVKKKS